MKNVLNIIKVLPLILIILIPLFCCSGCLAGVVSEAQYKEIFSNVIAEDQDGKTITYNMGTLIDNTTFNTEIQSRAYCKLDINSKKTCQVLGVVFLVRSSKTCTLTFTVKLSSTSLVSKTMKLQSETNTDIDLFFENAVTVYTWANFYIEIEEAGVWFIFTRTNFMFDSMIIFLKE